MPFAKELTIPTGGQCLHEFTDAVRAVVEHAAIDTGLCTIFVRHTSASLIIQENADPSAKHDLEAWFNRLVPERDRHYTHTAEGPDDMPAHIKSTLTATSITIPIMNGELTLGTWQGIYLWEHRTDPHERKVVVMVN
ncbi:MAG: secondary thiamine-phosphate synthase enzyme YjbQ [Phycisphaerales bacterium]